MGLSSVLPVGGTYIITRSNADSVILTQADIINNSVINFNGDDAIALVRL
jgi:hypothetical protein